MSTIADTDSAMQSLLVSLYGHPNIGSGGGLSVGGLSFAEFAAQSGVSGSTDATDGVSGNAFNEDLMGADTFDALLTLQEFGTATPDGETGFFKESPPGDFSLADASGESAVMDAPMPATFMTSILMAEGAEAA